MAALTRQAWEGEERELLRLGFDVDPDTYDRTRPVAPAAVFDEVVRLGRLAPGSTVVEIGPGTGQATRPLAARGLRILALEIGPRLAERARRNLTGFPDVTVRTCSFEDWDPSGERYDAVFACNSFHWIDPDRGFAKAAAVLDPEGSLVTVSTPVVVPDGADRFWADVQDDWAAIGAPRIDPATKHPDVVADYASALPPPGLFGEATVVRHRFDLSVTAEEYAANLSTQTDVRRLPPGAREELLARVRRRVESRGGRLTVHHLAVVTVRPRA